MEFQNHLKSIKSIIGYKISNYDWHALTYRVLQNFIFLCFARNSFLWALPLECQNSRGGRIFSLKLKKRSVLRYLCTKPAVHQLQNIFRQIFGSSHILWMCSREFWFIVDSKMQIISCFQLISILRQFNILY